MSFYFGKRSRANLEGVHSDLVIVMATAIRETGIDFAITEGLRTLKRQKQLVESGASKTLKSRHLTGHAVDVAAYLDGEIRWDWPLYEKIAKSVKAAAKECKIPIEWGGEAFGPKFRDGPHFQLPRRQYPE